MTCISECAFVANIQTYNKFFLVLMLLHLSMITELMLSISSAGNMVLSTSAYICMHICYGKVYLIKFFQSPLHTFYDLILLFIMATSFSCQIEEEMLAQFCLLLFLSCQICSKIIYRYMQIHIRTYTCPNRYGSKVSLTKYKMYK